MDPNGFACGVIHRPKTAKLVSSGTSGRFSCPAPQSSTHYSSVFLDIHRCNTFCVSVPTWRTTRCCSRTNTSLNNCCPPASLRPRRYVCFRDFQGVHLFVDNLARDNINVSLQRVGTLAVHLSILCLSRKRCVPNFNSHFYMCTFDVLHKRGLLVGTDEFSPVTRYPYTASRHLSTLPPCLFVYV